MTAVFGLCEDYVTRWAALDQRLREMLEKERLLLHYQLQYSPNDALRGMEAFHKTNS